MGNIAGRDRRCSLVEAIGSQLGLAPCWAVRDPMSVCAIVTVCRMLGASRAPVWSQRLQKIPRDHQEPMAPRPTTDAAETQRPPRAEAPRKLALGEAPQVRHPSTPRPLRAQALRGQRHPRTQRRARVRPAANSNASSRRQAGVVALTSTDLGKVLFSPSGSPNQKLATNAQHTVQRGDCIDSSGR